MSLVERAFNTAGAKAFQELKFEHMANFLVSADFTKHALVYSTAAEARAPRDSPLPPMIRSAGLATRHMCAERVRVRTADAHAAR